MKQVLCYKFYFNLSLIIYCEIHTAARQHVAVDLLALLYNVAKDANHTSSANCNIFQDELLKLLGGFSF